MSETGFAVFVIVAFLLPVPVLAWLDRPRGGRIVLATGAAVFSHFLLDLPVHPPDLALWPDASVHLGLGLWRTLPTGWWFVELLMIVAASAYYLWAARRSELFGRHALVVVGVVLVLHVFNAPWLAPY